MSGLLARGGGLVDSAGRLGLKLGSLESDFGFAVDEVHAEWDSSSGVIEVTAKVATRHVVSEW